MGPFFRKTSHDSHEATWLRQHPDPHPEPQRIRRTGHATTTKIKAVCKLCNTVWMSQMEGRVAPFMKLMIQAHHVSLGRTLQTCLAEWVALKMMVLQRAQNARESIDRDTCVQFRADRIVKPIPSERYMPPNLRIWLFHSPDPRSASFIHRDVAVMSDDGTAPNERPPTANTQAVLFGVGPVLIYATQTSLAEATFDIRPDLDWAVTLWPRISDVVVWPPERSLKYEDVLNIQGTFARFMAQATPI